jgi:farnesyl-diphosphate farnesyltransferase
MFDLERLLVRTSRTFAAAIPLLPEPCRRQVTLAYLVFRVADTLEDAPWPRAQRLQALMELGDLLLLRTPASAASHALATRWHAEAPSRNTGYLELLAEVPAVLATLHELAPAARGMILHHAGRTVAGMASVLAYADENGWLQLRNLASLREYCYVVAGIVGELLTELFILQTPVLESVADVLRGNAAAFGEALQLVNILRDAADDAREGRMYIPPGLDTQIVVALAYQGLRAAGSYVAALDAGGAPPGVLAFTALPVLLANATLERTVRVGPGAKLERREVAELMSMLLASLDAGRLPDLSTASP